MTHATTVQLVEPTAHARKIDLTVKAWLSGYKNSGTRRCYAGDLADFIGWCDRHGVDPISARRTHLDLWARDMEARELAASTVSRRITATHMWFRFLVAEEVVDRDPTVLVTRPRVPKGSRRPWMSRTELHDYLAAAEGIGGYTHALVCLLAFNGLRIGETIATDVADLGEGPVVSDVAGVGEGRQAGGGAAAAADGRCGVCRAGRADGGAVAAQPVRGEDVGVGGAAGRDPRRERRGDREGPVTPFAAAQRDHGGVELGRVAA